jgi:predicted HTH domain antitoxin
MKVAEVTISTRIPRYLEKELKEFIDAQEIDRSIAVRKLLSSGLQKWKEETALHFLEAGHATLSKAAKIAGMDVWSFAEKVKTSQINWVKIKPEVLRKELAELLF